MPQRTQSEYETPHGRIDLSSCMTVKSAEQKTSKRNALEVSTHDTTYFMYANTEKVYIMVVLYTWKYDTHV